MIIQRYGIVVRIVLGIITAVVFVTGASALFKESDDAKELLSQYEKTGETVNCVMTRQVGFTDALDDYSLLVEVGNDLYLNELSNRCIGLEREQRYVRSSSQTQMCKGDIIRVIGFSGTSYGSCSLGEFQKLSKIDESD